MIIRSLPILLTLAFAACSSAELTPEELCLSATEHFADCMGVQLEEGYSSSKSCDEVDAQKLLNTSCEDLSSPNADWGSDRFLAFVDLLPDTPLCAAGFESRCPLPTCQETVESPESCAEYLTLDGCGACDYYDCREKESAAQCGDGGYYKEYGAKNCKVLTQLARPRMSAHGQQWLDSTRQCLLEFIQNEIPVEENSCDSIMSDAMASHVKCYVTSGFCELALHDQIVLGQSIKLKDLDIGTIAKTEAVCLSIKAGLNPYPNENPTDQ